MKRFGLQFIAGTIFLVLLSFNAQAETITGQTSMTVINVTKWHTGDKSYFAEDTYLYDVDIVAYQHITWRMNPYPLLWGPIKPGGSMVGGISNVRTYNSGVTWESTQWDGIGTTTTGKEQEGQMPGNIQWVGTFLATWCDIPQKPGECNARKRTNVYFATER